MHISRPAFSLDPPIPNSYIREQYTTHPTTTLSPDNHPADYDSHTYSVCAVRTLAILLHIDPSCFVCVSLLVLVIYCIVFFLLLNNRELRTPPHTSLYMCMTVCLSGTPGGTYCQLHNLHYIRLEYTIYIFYYSCGLSTSTFLWSLVLGSDRSVFAISRGRRGNMLPSTRCSHHQVVMFTASSCRE